MKKLLLLLVCIIVVSWTYGQEMDTITGYHREFNTLLNYTPPNFEPDEDYYSPTLEHADEFNAIGMLSTYAAIGEVLGLTKADLEWLNRRTVQLAEALFADGKKILIGQVGGYSGCPSELLDTITLAHHQVTLMSFCYSCTDRYRNDSFAESFNKKMYALMRIKPPDFQTSKFYGNYEAGRRKVNAGMTLSLSEDRTFLVKLNSTEIATGIWDNAGDTLTLTTRVLTEQDRVQMVSGGVSWVSFQHKEMLLKKDKLIDLKDQRWQLKRVR